MPTLPTAEQLVAGYNAGGPLNALQITGREALPTVSPISPTTPTKPVGMISTDQAIPALNDANKAQDTGMQQITDTQTTEQKNKAENQKNFVQSVKNQGGLTADEIAAIGGDVNNYDFVSGAGLYLPKQVQTPQEQTDAELASINDTFKEQQAFADQASANLMSSIDAMYSGIAAKQRELNAQSQRETGTTLMRTGISRYAPFQANTILTNNASLGLQKLSDIAAKEASAMAEAEQLRIDKSYELFVKKRDEITALKKERLDALKKLQEEAQKKKDAIAEQQRQASRDGAIGGLIQQGITDPAEILNYLNYDQNGNLIGDFTAKEVGEAIKNLSGGTSTDLGQDYNLLQEAKKQGWLSSDASIFDLWKMKANAQHIASTSGKTVSNSDGTYIVTGLSQEQSQKLQDIGLNPTQAENAAGIFLGTRPPLTGFGANSKEGMVVTAGLNALGYNLTQATEDWQAMQKRISTMNGTQQVRLQQAITFSYDSLDIIDQLNSEWQGGQFPILNKANLALAKNGAFGKDAQSLATRLDAQINDLTSELGTVYKGGNSSTDESLKLAAGNLKSDWSQQTLDDAINLARTNLKIRLNSIKNSSMIEGNIYSPTNTTDGLSQSIEDAQNQVKTIYNSNPSIQNAVDAMVKDGKDWLTILRVIQQ